LSIKLRGAVRNVEAVEVKKGVFDAIWRSGKKEMSVAQREG
jgi:hypothetical protein